MPDTAAWDRTERERESVGLSPGPGENSLWTSSGRGSFRFRQHDQRVSDGEAGVEVLLGGIDENRAVLTTSHEDNRRFYKVPTGLIG